MTTGNKKVSINHLLLKDPKKCEEYKGRTEKAMEKMIEDGKEPNWFNLSQMITKEAAGVVGRMLKRRDSPWLEGHEEEAQGEHRQITEISSELFSLIGASKQCLTDEEKEQKDLAIKVKRAERKRRRKIFRNKLRGWERTWWQQIIDQCQEAEQQSNLGKMYQILTKLGMRDSKTASARDYFTPQQYKLHFETVSKDRYEESEETRKKAIEKITDIRDSEAARIEAGKLNSPITHTEIFEEWSKVKDGAP